MSPSSNGTAVAVAGPHGADIEQVVVNGNLASLTNDQRLSYYKAVCDSMGLNPLTQPFAYITLNNKLTLYAGRGATDQLRKIHSISVERLERETTEGVYVVTAYGRDASGRTDSAIGAVPLAGLRGEALANAMMKAETKAKRRLTLSLAGLGWLDESEIGSIPAAQRTDVDPATGEILSTPQQIQAPARTPTVVPAVDDADVAALHGTDPATEAVLDAVWSPSEIESALETSEGLSAAELFQRAEQAGIPKARLTVAAKAMFGIDRWKVTDLTDAERADLWAGFEVEA